jgi:hypothetical protein
MGKSHVIFLGAGASKSSGYPVANELRLMLCSESRLKDDVLKLVPHNEAAASLLTDYLHSFKDSIPLFREGGFATVDEFSKLASSAHHNHAMKMKHLTQLALGLRNPEDTFEKSDYYRFVQKLFDDDDLHSLRRDVTIISFNYDAYLDYLLVRAHGRRKGVVGMSASDSVWDNILSSGFYQMDNTDWFNALSVPRGFHHYKLHGSIAFGDTKSDYLYKALFEKPATERILKLIGEDGGKTPPIIFPWEIFEPTGSFIKEDEFVHRRPKGIYKLYRTIWEGARDAVAMADKISFVGLSAHPYMEPGLRYLFNGVNRRVEIVVANPENEDWRAADNRLHPASLSGRFEKMFKRVAPKMQYVKSTSEHDGRTPARHGYKVKTDPWQPDITPRFSFKEFIEREMFAADSDDN